MASLLDDLLDWLRIPSISTGGGDPADLERAATWVVDRLLAAGGTGELVTMAPGVAPLAVGELPAMQHGAPTVLIYGHYDVQGPGRREAWESAPFEPEVRDGRLYARGASDDKGNFLPLLHVACRLAAERALPVNVRVLVEGEEEAGSEAVAQWVREDERGADGALIFDSGMVDPATPAITLGLRGVVRAQVTVRTGARDLHSGMYGGTVLNALHVLHGMLAAVLPGPDGRVRPELRAGVAPPAREERDSWRRLPPGEDVIAEVGGRPLDPRAGAEYHHRTGADAALDVNEITGGEPRTIVPAEASAVLSLRLAPGQRADPVAATLERLLRAAAPPGAEVGFRVEKADPALFAPTEPVVRIAEEAIARACGAPPALVRSGGTIPVVAELARRGIPTVVSGFALAEDDIHAPNESYRLESLALGERAAEELYRALAALPKRA